MHKMASDPSVNFLYKKYYLLMNNDVETSSISKRSLCLWFQNPMASKALTIARTPSITASEARNFLQIDSKFCDPITEYNEHLYKSRPKTEWAMYGHPIITNRRHKFPSNKSPPSPTDSGDSPKNENKSNMSNTKTKPTTKITAINALNEECIVNDTSDTDSSDDSQTSIITESDESSLYNLREINKIASSNPVIGTYNREDDILTNKPFKMWHSNITLYAMNIVNNAKMVMEQVYNAGISDQFSSDSIPNANSITSTTSVTLISDTDTPP